jgi:UDP-galactopyranose mutase
VANYKGEIYNMPLNMNTFDKMWGSYYTCWSKRKNWWAAIVFELQETRKSGRTRYSLVDKDLYQKIVKGYTEKQWGKKAEDLPDFIIRRIPVSFTYDKNYFNDSYQGILQSVDLFKLLKKMIDSDLISVEIGVDFLTIKLII